MNPLSNHVTKNLAYSLEKTGCFILLIFLFPWGKMQLSVPIN